MENNLFINSIFIYYLTFSYLIGSIPFGYIIFYFTNKKDIRTLGSGNIGATNVYRSAGKKPAAITLLLDLFKGILVVYFGYFYFGPEIGKYSAVLVVIGHMFPIWLKFRGGKGVATSLGVIFIISWPVALLAVFTWVIILYLFKYSSIAAIFTSIICPIIFKITMITQYNYNNFSFVPGNPDEFIIILLISIMIIIKHKSNIIQLTNNFLKD